MTFSVLNIIIWVYGYGLCTPVLQGGRYCSKVCALFVCLCVWGGQRTTLLNLSFSFTFPRVPRVEHMPENP